MTEPMTVNVGLIVPNTGDLVDTWGSAATNPDYVAIDGLIAGVQTISATNVPITLTAPAAFVPTPGGGPTQSQNRVLRFTGVISGDVRVTLPLPGAYIIENLTTGNFVLSFQGVTATEVIGTPQGERLEIYNDGANVRFVNLGRMGVQEMWSGLSAMPAWVGQCTVKPYLLCDGTVYNYSDFPFLGPRLNSQFGGNGITTFATQDLRGRVPLAYDGTGTRITVAGCGINGQTIGAAAGPTAQVNTLGTTHLPPYTPTGGVSGAVTFPDAGVSINVGGTVNGLTRGTVGSLADITGTLNPVWTGSFVGNAQGGTSTPVNNVQPSIVTGIWVVKT